MSVSKHLSLNHSLCACFAVNLKGGHEREGRVRSMWDRDPQGAA